MTNTNPTFRLSFAAFAAAGALAGALATTAGPAAAQSAYQSQTYPAQNYPAQPAYQPPAYTPPAYQAPSYDAPRYQGPAYRPQVSYLPPPGAEAQPAYPPPPAYHRVEELTVIAPGVHRRDVGRSDSGMPIEELTASRVVNIRDLDLSRQADVDTMDYRVRMAAVEACGALERSYPESLYPSYPSTDADRCVVRAINEGVAQEREAVATAEANAYAAAAYRR